MPAQAVELDWTALAATGARAQEGPQLSLARGWQSKVRKFPPWNFPHPRRAPSAEPGDGKGDAKDSSKEGTGEGEEKGLGTGVSISGVCGDGAQCDGSWSESANPDGGSSAPGGGSSPAGGGSSAEGGGSSAAGGAVSAACVLAASSSAGGGGIWPCIGGGNIP